MPIFELQNPDGKTYEIDAPNQEAAINAFKNSQFYKPVQEQPAQEESTAMDIAKSGGIGLVKGGIGLAGSLGDAENLLVHGYDWLTGNQREQPYLPGFPTSDFLQKKLESYTGPLRQPETTAGQYAETIGTFLPSIAVGPLGAGKKVAKELAERALTRAVLPGAASEAGGRAFEDTPMEGTARLVGALVGGAVPSAARRAITPNPVANAELQKSVDVLRRENVPVTAGQATGNQRLKAFESENGMLQASQEGFTRAALNKIGVDAPRATPSVMSQALDDVSSKFAKMAGSYSMPIDNTVKNSLKDVLKRYQDDVNPSSQVPLVKNRISDILKNKNGELTGNQYKALRSDLSKSSVGKPFETKQAINEIIDTLDESMERKIGSINPDDLGAWRDARDQYRRYLVLEKAIDAPGSNAAQGIISPSALRNATRQVYGKRSYLTGDGPFAELAQAGEAALRDLPNSGTTARSNMDKLARALSGVAIGGSSSIATGDPSWLLLSAAPYAGSAIKGSKLGQKYLANQMLLPRPDTRNSRQKLLDALLTNNARTLPLRLDDNE